MFSCTKYNTHTHTHTLTPPLSLSLSLSLTHTHHKKKGKEEKNCLPKFQRCVLHDVQDSQASCRVVSVTTVWTLVVSVLGRGEGPWPAINPPPPPKPSGFLLPPGVMLHCLGFHLLLARRRRLDSAARAPSSLGTGRLLASAFFLSEQAKTQTGRF